MLIPDFTESNVVIGWVTFMGNQYSNWSNVMAVAKSGGRNSPVMDRSLNWLDSSGLL